MSISTDVLTVESARDRAVAVKRSAVGPDCAQTARTIIQRPLRLTRALWLMLGARATPLDRFGETRFEAWVKHTTYGCRLYYEAYYQVFTDGILHQLGRPSDAMVL